MLSIDSQETETIGLVPVETLSKAQVVITQPLSQTNKNFNQASKRGHPLSCCVAGRRFISESIRIFKKVKKKQTAE